MEGRCVWCHRSGSELKEIELVSRDRFGLNPKPKAFLVHREHEQPFTDFHARVQKHGWLFLAALGICTAAAIGFAIALTAGARSVGILGCGAALMLLGGVILALPFSTPETVSLFGVRTAIRLVRVSALVVIALGIFVAMQARLIP